MFSAFTMCLYPAEPKATLNPKLQNAYLAERWLSARLFAQDSMKTSSTEKWALAGSIEWPQTSDLTGRRTDEVKKCDVCSK